MTRILYTSRWKKEEFTSMGLDEQVTSHNATTPNIQNDRRME